MSAAYLIHAAGGEPEPLLASQTEVRDADWSGDGEKIVLAHSLGPKDSDARELESWIGQPEDGKGAGFRKPRNVALVLRWTIYFGHSG